MASHSAERHITILDGKRFLGPDAPITTYSHYEDESKVIHSTTDLGRPLENLELPPISVRQLADDSPPEQLFHRPNSYIRYSSLHDHDEVIDDDFDQVIYEIDSEDEAWLGEHGTKFENSESGLHVASDGSISIASEEGELSISAFEWMMQWLEKDAFVKQQRHHVTSARHTLQYDDTPCSVCRIKESTDLNQIVLCDGCDVSVHQNCYGCRSIPDGPWLCDPCTLNIAPSIIFCALCGRSEGAFKPVEHRPEMSTSDSDSSSSSTSTTTIKTGPKSRKPKDITNWAHVQCALWLPHAEMTSKTDCGGFVRIRPISKLERHHPPCIVCSKSIGDTVRCQRSKCNNCFHVMCGQKKCFAIVREADGSLYAWCDKHTPERYLEWRKEQITTTARENLQRKRKKKRTKDNAMHHFSWAVSSSRKTHITPTAEAVKYWGGVMPGTAIVEMLKDYARTFPTQRPLPSEAVVFQLFDHWTHKRSRLRGVPLLKNFHPSNVVGNASVLLNMTQPKNVFVVYTQLLRVRAHLALLLELSSLIVKREKLKQLKTMAKVRLYQNILNPDRSALLHVLHTVCLDFDKNRTFLASATTRCPIDWAIILQNIHSGLYDNDVETPGGGSFFADLNRVVEIGNLPARLHQEASQIREKLTQLSIGNVSSLKPDVHPLSIMLPRAFVEETLARIKLSQPPQH